MKAFPPVLFCFVLLAAASAQDSKGADSVAALRETLSHPGWSIVKVYSRIEACLNEGQAVKAERLMRQQHNAATDDAVKATLFGAWIWTSHATGSLDGLMKEFTARRDANRDSSLAWLELAVVSDAAQTFIQIPKDCLLEAAKRNPGSTALLTIIVAQLEEHDMWRDALAAMTRWRKLEPGPRMTGALACLELLVDDDLRGWELAKEVASAKADDPSALREVIETACELREWRRAAALAQDGLKQWPDDTQLLCLRAVALEESGQDDVAAAAYLRILALRDTKHPAKPASDENEQRWRNGIRLRGKLPEGVKDIAQLSAWTERAYAYRRNMDGMGMKWGREIYPALYLPETESDVRAFALLHLNSMSRDGAKVPQADIFKALAASGHESMAVVAALQADRLSPEKMSEILLRDHAQDEKVFAWWLSGEYGRWRAPKFAPVLEHCAKLFADRYPALAFHAAIQLARIPGADQTRHQAFALERFRALAEVEPKIARSEAYMLDRETGKWPVAKEWRDAMIPVLERGTKEAPETWMRDSSPGDMLSRYECGLALLQVLSADHRWEAHARFLDDESKRPLPLNVLLHGNPFGSYAQGASLLSDAAMAFPNALLLWPHSIIETLGVFHDPETRTRQSLPEDKSWIACLQNPLLKVTAQWRTGDIAGANAEIERRIRQPDATLADWWLAAWLAWQADTIFPDDASEQHATRTAAERLARAAEFPAEGHVRLLLDAALLRSVLALKERPAALADAAHAAARRFCNGTMPSTYDTEDLKAAFGHLGFTEEAARIGRAAIVPHPAAATAYGKTMMPGTTLGRYRGPQQQGDDGGAGKAKPERDAVARRALQKLHHAFPGSSWFPRIGVSRNGTKDVSLQDAVAALAIPREDATPRELLRAGQDFELLGKPEFARTHYETAARQAPQLSEARSRLAILLLDEHADEAEKMIEALPDHACAPVVEALVERIRPEVQEKTRGDAMRVLVTWLRHLAAAKKDLPADCVVPLQHALLEKKSYPGELCVAALGIRDIADDALARIGEEAMRRRQPLVQAAAFAKALLRAKAVWPYAPPWGIQTRTESKPAEDRVEHPNAMLILIWDAWQRQAPQEIESVILPLLRQTEYPPQDETVRCGSALFFCASAEFPAAAQRFAENEAAHYATISHSFTDHFFDGGTLDFVNLVWHLRHLTVPLDDLFISQLAKADASDTRMEAVTNYLNLAGRMSAEQMAAFIRRVRDQLVGGTEERRRTWFAAARERSRHVPERWSRTLALPAGTNTYVRFLRVLGGLPHASEAASQAAQEDGITLAKPSGQ